MTVQLEGVLADRDSWRADRCSVARALDVVGTRSAMLLLREAYYGGRRFDDLARRVGITETVAAARLRELVDAGLLVKEPYREPGQRTRHEYVLTPMGRDLLPAVIGLMQWGDRWLQGERGPGIALQHVGCGAQVGVEIRCTAGHPVPSREIAAVAVRERRPR